MSADSIEDLKWLWDSTTDAIILKKVAQAICAKGSPGDLKWLWGATSNAEILRNVAQALCDRGSSEDFRFIWERSTDAIILRMVADAICSRGNNDDRKWLYDRTNDSQILRNIADAMTSNKKETNKQTTETPIDKLKDSMEKYHFFICHASEDKESFVRALAHRLEKEGFRVWYDEFALTLGDSLRRKIDEGLSQSHFGIVVLSTHFFKKEWPQKELDALIAKEEDRKVILPIWHDVTYTDIVRFSPILAGKLGVSTSKGLDNVVVEIMKAYNDSRLPIREKGK